MNERKPAPALEHPRRRRGKFGQSEGDLLAADRLFIVLLGKPAAFVRRIAERDGKLFAVFFGNFLQFAAHRFEICEGVQANGTLAHLRKLLLHFKHGDGSDLRMQSVKMQPHHAAARAKIGDDVPLPCPAKAGEQNGIAGKAVQLLILNDFQVPLKQFFDGLVGKKKLPFFRRLCFTERTRFRLLQHIALLTL